VASERNNFEVFAQEDISALAEKCEGHLVHSFDFDPQEARDMVGRALVHATSEWIMRHAPASNRKREESSDA
jgi:hypothetical protein